MKQRFSYLDLQLVAGELAAALEGARLQNVYTLESSARQFLFKFDGAGKRLLFVDPGQRAHLTEFQHTPAATPPHFVQTLRRHLQNRRLSRVFVVEGTRTLCVAFSDNTLFLVLELFSGGNIMVVENGHITALLRTVKPAYVHGAPYAFAADVRAAGPLAVAGVPLARALAPHATAASASLLFTCLRARGLDPKRKLSAAEAERDAAAIQASVDAAVAWAQRLVAAPPPYLGFILRDKEGPLEFEPFREYFDEERAQNAELAVEELPSYNKTIDVFFGRVWTERQGSKLDAIRAQADARRQRARDEHAARVDALHAEAARHERLGELVTQHADLVAKAIAAVTALQQQGVDWGSAERLIALEKEKGNDVAEAIAALKLEKNAIVLTLDGEPVTVDLGLSALANARAYFDRRRETQARTQKTVKHVAGALRSAETRIAKDLERSLQQQQRQAAASALRRMRQPYWFEKFYWFLTSQGRLVVAGRDAPQNELLLRRYFEPADLLVFQPGPNSTIALLKGGGGPQSLVQAANFVSASAPENWETKSRAECYYLTRAQVPAQTRGEPVTVAYAKGVPGRVAVQPTSLEMGVALLWQVDNGTESEEAQSEDADAPAAVAAVSAATTSDADESEVGATGVADDGDGAEAEVEDEVEDEEFPDIEFHSDQELDDADFPEIEFDSENEAAEEEEAPADGTSEVVGSGKDGAEEIADRRPAELEVVPDVPASADLDSTGEPVAAAQRSSSSSASSAEATPEPGEYGRDSADPGETESQSKPIMKTKLKVRGHKKKLRKYLDQDEEDRQAAMERLGTLKGLERRRREEQERREQKEREQRQKAEREARRRLKDLSFVDTPEAQPLPTDLEYALDSDARAVAAVPMFGPWAALQPVQRKVKLALGQLKKGKATTEILAQLGQDLGPNEARLLDAVRPVDVQNAIAVTKLQLAGAKSAVRGKPAKAKGGKSKPVRK